MARRYASRTNRRYLIDFCVTWICEDDRPLDQIDIEAVIEGRIAEYDQRGFKLGNYYNGISKASFYKLKAAIKKEVEQRRRAKAAHDRQPKDTYIVGNPWFTWRTDRP